MAPKVRRDLSVLITQRDIAKANIERIYELVLATGELLQSSELDCRLEIVETYFLQALNHQSSIEEFGDGAVNSNAAIVRGELEELYCQTKVKIKNLMQINSNKKVTPTQVATKMVDNLPKLKLPMFSGKYAEFPNFMRLFIRLVDEEPRLSTIVKFNHLVSCLSGSALRTIKALDLIEENYPVALKILRDRFDNKYLMCQEHIKELFQLNKIQKGSPEQLRTLIDTVASNFNALCSMLTYEEISQALIVHLCASSLDAETQDKLDESIDCSKILSWNDCFKILTQRCQMLETREIKSNNNTQSRQNKHVNKSPKNYALSAIQNNCKCCNLNSYHPLWKCPEFLKLSPLERFHKVKELSLCINCFSFQHTVRQCKSSTCKNCKGLHHTLLHRERLVDANQSSTGQNVQRQQTHAPLQQYLTTKCNQQQLTTQQSHSAQQQLPSQPQQWHQASAFEMPSGNNAATATTSSMVGNRSSFNLQQVNHHTILATAMVQVVDKYGNKYVARALLDSASQLNFITHNFAQKLNLDKVKVTTVVGGIGESQTHAKYSTTAHIKSCISNYATTLECLILPSIAGMQPLCNINTNSWNIPDNIRLADPKFNKPQKVDLLIGADLFFELFDGEQLKIGPNFPMLMHTVFGWVVSGRCKIAQQTYALMSSSIHAEPDIELGTLVKQFWDFEKVPNVTRKLTREQEDCEEHFAANTKRLPCGRFEVRLPFKASPTVLGNSKIMATRRFLNIENRLANNNSLKQAYTEFLAQYELEGHMHQVTWPENLTGFYIMPHHCVLRPDKSTTKCRVVFDASAQSSNNLALNDILKVGPVVQPDLLDILLRFRLHKYGLMGDIAAMYRQIRVHAEDCKVQNIIWRTNPSEELKLYQLNTVTYGTASAPYLATRCLMQLAQDFQQTYPEACSKIKHDFYMDDLITGGSTLQDIQQIKLEVSRITAQAGFLLRKWFSNHPEFLTDIPEEEREKPININNTAVVKTLGVIWDANADCLKFHYTSDDNNIRVITKRKVLSEMSKLFDPLGLVKPVIVKTKIFMQELWLKNLNWDEAVPDECAKSWRKFVQQLTDLNAIKIPRYVLLANAIVELHGFADASTRAYGCCVYSRCIDAAGKIKISLLSSRSKVAPISTVRSLPCLELCGAHLLTQLFLKVRTIHNFNKFFFWSDSVIVLQWLAEHASSLNTFVANRVSFIQENTAGMLWKYVPSASNPADLVSRGATVQELTQSIWFSGPQFLENSMESWPKFPKALITKDLPEQKPVKTVLVSMRNELLTKIYSGSNFNKTCSIIAYVRRFIHNCRQEKTKDKSKFVPATAEELDQAFIMIISWIQQATFATEIMSLKQNKQVHHTSILKALNPFLELEKGFTVLKVGGRLKYSTLPYLAKCPIIVPKNDQFIETYVSHLHATNFHAGAQALVCILQQRFWVIGAREYARKIVNRCLLCFKYRPKMLSQMMGNLPAHRVTPMKPFTHCGVDFCGPILTTSRIKGKPKYKSYIAVFVCFITRAIHMEVVSALTTDAFIAALKRFIGRRGLCTTLYCDNATNFVGARNLLNEFKTAFNSKEYQQRLNAWFSSTGINFRHIPPRSPHFGGLWEAAVKSAKTLLYKVMQSAVLTFEELSTLVAQIEGMLNSRPLTEMSTDPSDERALTPSHFLNQSKNECLLEPVFDFKNISTMKHWEKISALQQHFWKRWSKEYLVLLQQRRKWTKELPNLKVGTLVMVHEENLPPQKWVIGRITNVIVGADDKIRVADIRTPSGVIRRSITKLAAIPVEP